MTEQEEAFVHFVCCTDWLNNAWRLLNVICTQQGNRLIGPAFQFALIEYSKPYGISRGTGKRRFALDTSCIPQEWIDLHTRIVNARDQVHAHSDLTVMEATLYIHNSKGEWSSAIVQNAITGIEELPNLNEIRALIEATLDNMYVKAKVLERGLAP